MTAKGRWARDVAMEDDWLPKQHIYDQLDAGKYQHDKPWKCYKDGLKCNLVSIRKGPDDNWENLALGRIEWRILVDDDCTSFQREDNEHASLKRHLR